MKEQFDDLDAYEALQESLTEEDLERLHGIRHEINHHINWGEVVSSCFSELLTSVEKIIFEGGENIAAQGHPPFQQLFPAEQNYIQDKNARRDYLLLKFTKKLVGALKTKTNQTLEEIPFLDLDDEDELRELFLDDDSPSDEDNYNPYDPKTSQDYFYALNDEVIDAEYIEKKTNPITNDDEKEISISADLKRQDSSTNCHHTSVTVSFVTENDGVKYLREFCKGCRRVIRKKKAQTTSTASPKECEHLSAAWVEGKEGKEAYCSECKLSPLPNPEIYNWRSVGLEPYGDDPSKDEIINLEKALSCGF